MARQISAICVYCGSRPGSHPRFADAARALGRAMVERDIALVFGGGHVGLMGVIADTVLELGGAAIGVIPRFMVEAERAHPGVTEQIVVQTMHQRKQTMSDRCDAIITLPGGMGTFDELFEAITWNLLGVHDRPLGVLDVDGYYEPLRRFIEQGVRHDFVTPATARTIHWSDRASDLIDRLINAPGRGPGA